MKCGIRPNIFLQEGEKWVGIATYTSLSNAPDHPARLARRVVTGEEGPRVPCVPWPPWALSSHQSENSCVSSKVQHKPLYLRSANTLKTLWDIFVYFLNFWFVPEFSCPITVHVNHMFQFIGDMKEDYLSLVPFSACRGVCFVLLI